MKRRVLHLRTVCGKGGGPEKTLLTTPRFLGSDYDVRLAYLRPACDPDYDMPERAREAGATLVDIPETGPVDPRSLLKLVREIRGFRPHILHAHDYKSNVLSMLFGRWFRVPAVTTMHGNVTLGTKLNWYYRIERWALRRLDHVIAVSPDLFDLALRLRVPETRLTLVENAIDTVRYRRQDPREECKHRLGLAPDRLLIGAVGRLQPEKAFPVLIDAAIALFEKGFDVGVVIAGEGPERAVLEEKLRKTAWGDRIRLLGHCNDMLTLYHALDVFVLSSVREGLPNVLLEAMALETPVVATRVAGVPRLIADKENGLLVPPGDPLALANAVAALVQDGTLRFRLSAAARATIEQRYSFTERMRKIRGIYDQVLGSPATGGERSEIGTLREAGN